MASSIDSDAPDTVPLPTAPRRRPAGVWSSLLARLRAAPIDQPFHDSDFEPTEWSATQPVAQQDPRRPS